MEVLGTPPALLFHTHSSERQQSTAELFLDELLHRKRRLHRKIEVYAVHGWICFLLLTSALPEGSQQPALSPSVRWRSGVLTAGPQAPSPAKLSSRAAPPGQPPHPQGPLQGREDGTLLTFRSWVQAQTCRQAAHERSLLSWDGGVPHLKQLSFLMKEETVL